jgi:cytochrome c-type biogenesis protein CcmH
MSVPRPMTETVSSLKQQLQQLQEMHDSGALSKAKYEDSRIVLERRLVEQVMRGEGPAAAEGSHGADAVTALADTPGQRMAPGFLAALVAGVLVLAVAGYAWKGEPALLTGASPVAARGQPGEAGEAGGSHETGADQIAAMVEKLAERMKAQPDDPQGWVILARSYTVLGRHAEAMQAYERAIALRGDDAALMVDYADSLAMNNNRTLAGEPMKWVDKALKLDPLNLKGLSLAGTAAFLAGDYAGAVKHWEKVVAVGPPDSAFVQQVQGGIAEARERGKLPAGARPATAAAETAAAAPAAIAGKTVSGTVSLAPALARLASPDDTVFVFARAAEGRGMPLAILRKKVSDLPIRFTLDDSTAMSPAATLSAAGTVIVGARISKSGNAMPQPGDLSGQSPPVAVGASALTIEIRDTVQP